MIVSASRRTDIPCYYGEWFLNRLKAGYVLTRNPFNFAQLSRVQLSPDVIDCIVFWTKDAKNMLPHLEAIDRMGYNYYFQFTLTPYDNVIERKLRDKSEIEDGLIELSKRISKYRVMWRYDPIVLNDTITLGYHKAQFERMCEKLSPFVNSVTVSFVDNYSKLKTPLIREITTDEMLMLAEFIGQTSKAYGLTPMSCCEKTDLTPYGINRASCIDKAIVEKISGTTIKINKDKNQREGCGCVESIDIGSYNTCLNGCIYCYANNGAETAKRRHDSHDPNSGLLIGVVRENEKIIERKVSSNKT